MSIGKKLSIVALAAAFGGLIAPSFAQNDPGGAQSGPDQGMSMGHTDHGMMRGGMMSHGMMGGDGCSQMMQSMNGGGNGRPNNLWQKHRPDDPDRGG